MDDRKFSFKNIPNYVLCVLLVLAYIIYVFFDNNLGYSAFSQQFCKIDTLTMECDELRQQITNDSVILDALSDSSKLDRFLHEKMFFVGDGETMYQIQDSIKIEE